MHTVENVFEPVMPGCSFKRVVGYKQLNLVIAPHPDDDVIGAGGMMALLSRSRRPAVVVYVTNGVRRGDSGLSRVRLRKDEAIAALRIVRARGAFFLPFTSQDVHTHPARVRSMLMGVISQIMPGVLYLPSPFEQHATHRVISRMVLSALRRSASRPEDVWGYCVWSALPPAPLVRTVDISDVVDIKRAAIEQHASQVSEKDFPDGILGLNRYAAVFSSLLPDKSSARYAEQFLDMRMFIRNKYMRIERFASTVFARGRALSGVNPVR